MNPQEPQQTQQPQQQPPQPNVNNPLSVMQPGERIICEIKRHPIGLIGTYITFGLVLIALAAIAFLVVPQVATSYSKSQILSISGLAYLILAAFILLFLFVAQKVYNGNRWIITSDSITQVTQRSLFDKQSSQLSLANLEDITAIQDGVLAHMFNYGTVRAETAGERSKFFLLYCPNPNYYAQQILNAREQFEQFRGGRGERSGVNVDAEGGQSPQSPATY